MLRLQVLPRRPAQDGPVGAGFEHAFNNRLSLKLEYLHFDLGRSDYSVPRIDGPIVTPWAASAKVSGDIVRAGFNYRFTP